MTERYELFVVQESFNPAVSFLENYMRSSQRGSTNFEDSETVVLLLYQKNVSKIFRNKSEIVHTFQKSQNLRKIVEKVLKITTRCLIFTDEVLVIFKIEAKY